jgi:hypothetical protein
MIGPRIKIGMVMFDRSVIRRNWSNTVRTPVTRAGLLVRKIARNSIRRATGKRAKPSPPGRPPKSRVKGGNPPFKLIFSVPNSSGTEATIGMIGFGKSGGEMPPPGIQEHGATVVRRYIVPGSQKRNRRGRFERGPLQRVRKTVKVAPRPFMAPALDKATPQLPSLFRGAFDRKARGIV